MYFTHDKSSYETDLLLEIWKKYLHLSNQGNKAAQHDILRHFTLTVCKVYFLQPW